MNAAEDTDALLESYLREDEPTAIMSRQELQVCLEDMVEIDEVPRYDSGVRPKIGIGTYSRFPEATSKGSSFPVKSW